MAILFGTQSNGETLPVEVNEFGQLVAKGIEGPQGPEGPPGVGELPPGAFDGAYLGWENGELVWVGTPTPPVVISGFAPFIYAGNGGTQSINCGFSPSLVWIKQRNATRDNVLIDVVRGPNEILYSNETTGQAPYSNLLNSFDSNGFTLGPNEIGNVSTGEYVAWCWDASDTTVTNNDGSIDSQVRSNGSFSIVSYQGTGANATFGHGLNNAPGLVIIKNTSTAKTWMVGHQSLNYTANEYMELNEANGKNNGAIVFNSQAPTSSIVNVGAAASSNGSTNNMIAYCWSEIPGGSSFGSYSGSGSQQTIQTGFRPSLVIIKSTGAGNWYLFDNARGASKALYANNPDSEDETGAIEFMDDGFQLLFNLPGVNESNETYIYAAFANPSDAAFAQRQLRRQTRQEERQQNETRLR